MIVGSHLYYRGKSTVVFGFTVLKADSCDNIKSLIMF
jgi:hypothetical protein